MTRTGTAVTERAAARAGRRLAVESLFEADFGQRTPLAALERRLGAAAEATVPGAEQVARQILEATTAHRDEIDALIEAAAPLYPVAQLGRIDRALLRSALGEMLHSATPTGIVIAEWVALARRYSGEPARRLVNGVLGRIARDTGNGRSNGRWEKAPAPQGRRR